MFFRDNLKLFGQWTSNEHFLESNLKLPPLLLFRQRRQLDANRMFALSQLAFEGKRGPLPRIAAVRIVNQIFIVKEHFYLAAIIVGRVFDVLFSHNQNEIERILLRHFEFKFQFSRTRFIERNRKIVVINALVRHVEVTSNKPLRRSLLTDQGNNLIRNFLRRVEILFHQHWRNRKHIRQVIETFTAIVWRKVDRRIEFDFQ